MVVFDYKPNLKISNFIRIRLNVVQKLQHSSDKVLCLYFLTISFLSLMQRNVFLQGNQCNSQALISCKKESIFYS